MSNAPLPRLWLSAALVVLVSGCTLVNPHVKWPPPTTPPRQASQIDLDYAIDYADSAKAAYRKALGTQSKLTSWLGVGLIPLAAASLGLGITGGPPAAIAALAATGAAGYATGTWLSSKPAQRAYVAGYNATSCAVSAVLPLVDVENRRSAIEQAIASVDTRVSAVETAVGIARARLTTVQERHPKPPEELAQLMAEARREIDGSRELVTSANDTRTKARKMLHEAAVAGLSLKEAVDRIAGQVSGALVETGPDLQSLAAIINGLAGSYGQFARVPETAKPTARGAEPQSDLVRTDEDIKSLRQALDALRSEMGQLRIAVAQLADEVNVVTASKPLDTLKACGVSLEQIAVPITIEPSARVEFEGGTPATKGFLVRGGAAPYSVMLLGDEGPAVRQTEPFGPAFTVQVTASTPAREYAILVSDRAGQRQFLQVAVIGTPRDAALPGPAAPLAGDLERTASGLPGRSFEIPNRGLTVTVATARVQGQDLLVEVKVSGAGGTTATEAEVNALREEEIRAGLLELRAVKDASIARERIRVVGKSRL
jgi:hypothetical protein